ncbi:MAG: futalosine hydrolase [Ginsengibacter sp.]
MNLLIVAATEFEIEPFLKENTRAEILITGVGIPATVFHLTKKISEKKFDFIIQAGIAGTFNVNNDVAEVVQVKEDTFADLGIEEYGHFKTLFDMGFINKNDFPFTDGWLINPLPSLQKNHLPPRKGITVNKISDDVFQNKMIREKFSPDVESMEGAAFHYVCLLQKINFLQIRSISNRVGERDKSKWKLKESIENLNNELLKIIENL